VVVATCAAKLFRKGVRDSGRARFRHESADFIRDALGVTNIRPNRFHKKTETPVDWRAAVAGWARSANA
jgi:hypothetical protein